VERECPSFGDVRSASIFRGIGFRVWDLGFVDVRSASIFRVARTSGDRAYAREGTREKGPNAGNKADGAADFGVVKHLAVLPP
jgi:hypothetical protein